MCSSLLLVFVSTSSLTFWLLSTEDVAEAEHDIWRKVHSQRSFFRNQLQRSIHTSPGKKKRTRLTKDLPESFGFCFLFVFKSVIVSFCRGWRSWTRRLQRRRWLKLTRNISLTWQSSSKSRRKLRCEDIRTPCTWTVAQLWKYILKFGSPRVIFYFYFLKVVST